MSGKTGIDYITFRRKRTVPRVGHFSGRPFLAVAAAARHVEVPGRGLAKATGLVETLRRQTTYRNRQSSQGLDTHLQAVRGRHHDSAMKNAFTGIKVVIDGLNYEISPINFIISPTDSIIGAINFIIGGTNLLQPFGGNAMQQIALALNPARGAFDRISGFMSYGRSGMFGQRFDIP